MPNGSKYDPHRPISVPFTMVIAGQSGAGKSTFTRKLLENLDSLCPESTPVEKIIYSYSVDQPLYREIEKIPRVEMHKGFPTVSDENNTPTLVVIDDMMTDHDQGKTVELFTRLRHRQYSTIFLTQNFFLNKDSWRTISQQTQYIVLFRNPRDVSVISYLNRQMYPGNPNFLPSAFEQATREPYTYLFIDLKPYTPEGYRVREGLFPSDKKYRFEKDA